jgi:broad specificity phosphatase PhoE
MRYFFISHSEVVIEPARPIERWGLSEAGRQQMRETAFLPWMAGVTRLVSSDETKAVESAAILSSATGIPFSSRSDLGENDRTATGYLPRAEFDATADQFFALPDDSIRGWETARHAQQRIVRAVREIATETTDATAIVSHGAVGTLLWCDLMGVPISRKHDQPAQGCYFAFDPESWTAEHSWRPLSA